MLSLFIMFPSDAPKAVAHKAFLLDLVVVVVVNEAVAP
jgi:hypothetical protein